MQGKTRILFIKTIPIGKGPFIHPTAVEVPLGLLYLSAYLKLHLNDSVEIKLFDFRIEKEYEKSLQACLDTFKPHMIGVSTLGFEQNFFQRYIGFIRIHASSSVIFIGGPYATTNYEEALTEYQIDYAVIGEGEAAALNLVKCHMNGGDMRSVAGIAFREGVTVKCNDREQFINDIDTIPFPDYSLIDFNRYWGLKPRMNAILAEKKYTQIITSRACPFKCIYCHDIFGKKVRSRSADNVVGEIKMLYHEFGVREFQIVDDIFNMDRERMHEILNMIIESGMKIKIAFPNGLKGDLLTEEDILLLKKAGAYMITVAVESTSPRIQKKIRKNLNILKILENIEFANSQGLITKAFFMLGFPDETMEELNGTIDFALASKLDLAILFIVLPVKKTKLFDWAIETYREKHENVDVEFEKGAEGKAMYEIIHGFDITAFQKKSHKRFFSVRRRLRLLKKLFIHSNYIASAGVGYMWRLKYFLFFRE